MERKLSTLIGLCLGRNIPFAAYRLPGQAGMTVHVQESGRMLFVEDIRDITASRGFVYAPFHRTTNMPVVFFEPELVLEADAIEESLLRAIGSPGPLYQPFEQPVPEETSREDYERQAAKMIGSFGPGLSKAVLSRVILEEKPGAFDPAMMFLNMAAAYPGAFVHLAHIPGAGTWMGATPELLFRSHEGAAVTTALAGTRKKEDDGMAWGGKEQEEQHLVTLHIEDVLRHSGISTFSAEGPVTVTAGGVQHLSTRFAFSHDPAAFDVMAFLKRLHPTPAVSGLPVDRAIRVIRDTEKHNREYYAGFCGPVDRHGSTDLFVNLRCMRVLPRHLAIYTGGGLTARSVVRDEWEETAWKAKTLLNLI